MGHPTKKGVFNGLPQDSIHPKFEKLFNDTMSRHYNSSNINMMALNKEFLSSFVKSTRQQANNRGGLGGGGSGGGAGGDIDSLEKIYDTNQIRKDVVDDFNREFASKQNEFNETIRLKRPEEVDFTDKYEEQPIDSNRIDELLKQQLEKRNLDIPKINETSQEFQKASDWITNSSEKTPEIQPTSSPPNSNKSVTFKDNVQIEFQSNTSPISVANNSQNDNQPRTNTQPQNARSSMKNGLLNNDTIHKKLDDILKNQEYIINNIHELLDRR